MIAAIHSRPVLPGRMPLPPVPRAGGEDWGGAATSPRIFHFPKGA
jgi:hypothetical protein